jgi:hypothetical protein
MGRGLERAIAERYGGSARGRIGLAALLGAVTVLIRKHPGAAVHAVGAGLASASRATLSEAGRLATTPLRRERKARLARRDRQALLRYLKEQDERS